VALAVAGLMVAATGSGEGEGAAAEDRAEASAKKKRTKLRLIDTRFGSILADRQGYALYLFTRDQEKAPSSGREKSRCYGRCADAWPVLKARGKLQVGKGLDSNEIGSTRRRNGDKQLTYNGHPLYYYVGDSKPKQVLCQDVREFGGVWYVVGADGSPVT